MDFDQNSVDLRRLESNGRPATKLDFTRPRRDAEPSVPLPRSTTPSASPAEAGLTLRRTSAVEARSASVNYDAGSGRATNVDLSNHREAATPGQTGKQAQKQREGVSGLLFPAPGFARVHHFSEDSPLARLNARQAGIGTLLISGARSTAWEGTDLITGAEDVNGNRAGTTIYTRGNRPLVAFHDGTAAVTLRHVTHLRRAIFVAADAPLIVGLFDGAAAAVPPANSSGERTVLYLARIGELLELRAEYLADASDQDLWAKFGFRMTTPLNARAARQ